MLTPIQADSTCKLLGQRASLQVKMLRRRKQCESYCHFAVANQQDQLVRENQPLRGQRQSSWGLFLYQILAHCIAPSVLRHTAEESAGTDTEKIIRMLSPITVGLQHQEGVQSVLLNGEDVSSDIRTPQISIYASQVSAIPEVRAYLLHLQRENGTKADLVIMDGRDIGTVILPHAQVKIFLTASVQARAERRCAGTAGKRGTGHRTGSAC